MAVPPDRSACITALVRGYRLAPSQAQHLPEMVCEVIAGCHRSVALKAAAGNPAFVRMEREAPSMSSPANSKPPNNSAPSSKSQYS